MSEAIVMVASARRRLVGGLFDLADFIAGAGGFFVTFGLDGVREVELEFGEFFVEKFAGKSRLRDLSAVRDSFVHSVQHWIEHPLKRVVTRWATEPAMLLEIELGIAA
jgi:hypothetical protein